LLEQNLQQVNPSTNPWNYSDTSIERRNIKVLPQTITLTHNPYILSEVEEKKTVAKQRENKQRLRVPRRPPWSKSMTLADLDRQEKEAFLEWRRGLAE